MPLRIVHQDITTMQVDAIVNAANTRLLMGGGVCGAIFRAAGARDMQEACDRLSPILTGCAVATPGFALSARYVIHTAGPIWQGGDGACCVARLWKHRIPADFRRDLRLSAGCSARGS